MEKERANIGEERRGLRIPRFYTRPGEDPYATVRWARRTSRITNPDGTVVFEMTDAEVPEHWSQVATDIVVSKYFRKAGVPQYDENGQPLLDEHGNPVLGPERSVRQVVRRLVGCWRDWGERYGYFATPEDAQAFEDELAYMLLHQIGAPNSPQWFNTGLYWAYGITGPAQGHWYVDPETGELRQSPDAYSHPSAHACFIQSVEDDLVNPGGIFDLVLREARVFKYGAGSGTNFSKIRAEGEPLSGGGTSSGLMSFLKVFDRAAGAIKSGGTTRRAAKMVVVDIDHPDIEQFIRWKAEEEKKVAALVAAGYSADFNGEAYATVSGQNSNNSVRVPDEFIQAVLEDREWHLRWRTDGRIAKTVRARDLWRMIAEAAWQCADPGIQYDTTINDWHTCPASGRINASNPCSEYMFLDDTACNLASLNLLKFYDPKIGRFDIAAFRHAVRLWTIVLEITVLMAQYPSREIAWNSYRFRTLGLGYANLGSLLMTMGLPYDSDQARAVAAAITAIMTGEAYATSAEMAAVLGPFPAFPENREHMLRVIRNHRRAAYDAHPEEYEGLHIAPQGLDPTHCPPDLLRAAREAWDRALELGERYGYRNAQATLLAPTGTIGLLMDCDTTGIEPDFALVKFKKIAGGGYFKIVNRSVAPALERLGYAPEQIEDILRYVLGTLSLDGTPHINRESLRARGFTDDDLARIEAALPGVFELRHAFSPYVLGEATMRRLGFTPEQWSQPGFDLLTTLGFTPQQIEEANDVICGRQTVEGAPHLKPEHLPVFDCANKCGKHGTRFIHYMGHIRMMAAVQPFLSGAISKTINMPHEVTGDDVANAYFEGWRLGLKALAIYRDG
ncbi:MAG: vitamin B12-dependent ribonucleotide reductase, partial [Thermomicrobium sp.]|nr:vitamin B12-dependent ribonucleotide reductase [Thermomicrobium sp.]MDW8007527.1 vitamin B12-dependent ribonucleotide reductase [Thermomicrobium sp.]